MVCVGDSIRAVPSIPRTNSYPAEVLSSKKLESTSSQLRLERAKTETHRPRAILAEQAAQIFDNNISVQQKVWIITNVHEAFSSHTVAMVFASRIRNLCYPCSAS